MSCPICDSDNINEIIGLEIPCRKCDEVMTLISYACRNCKAFWTTLDNAILSIEYDDETVELADSGIIKDLESMFDYETGDVKVIELNKKGTMNELIHRCLKCGVLSYEINPGVYHCPDCGFEWEVI